MDLLVQWVSGQIQSNLVVLVGLIISPLDDLDVLFWHSGVCPSDTVLLVVRDGLSKDLPGQVLFALRWPRGQL